MSLNGSWSETPSSVLPTSHIQLPAEVSRNVVCRGLVRSRLIQILIHPHPSFQDEGTWSPREGTSSPSGLLNTHAGGSTVPQKVHRGAHSDVLLTLLWDIITLRCCAAVTDGNKTWCIKRTNNFATACENHILEWHRFYQKTCSC